MSRAAPLLPMMPYRILRDFLPEAERDMLLSWALANEMRFRPAVLSGGVIDPDRRRASVLRDLGPMGPVIEARIAAA